MIKKYLNLFKKKFFYKKNFYEQQKSISEPAYIGSIKFLLKKTNEIDIICSVPKPEIDNVENISLLAEKYAWFLLNITDGIIVDDIIKKLKHDDSLESDHDHAQTLFIDNVLFFWNILSQENQKKIYKKLCSNEPLIKPSTVFSIKNNI